MKLVGGGDAKLIAAVTILVQPSQIATLLLGIAVMGGVLSCIYLIAQRGSRRQNVWEAAGGHERRRSPRGKGWIGALGAGLVRRKTSPYGVAVFWGAATFALTNAVRWLYATS
jgi:prepilin peptidase CpaA